MALRKHEIRLIPEVPESTCVCDPMREHPTPRLDARPFQHDIARRRCAAAAVGVGRDLMGEEDGHGLRVAEDTPAGITEVTPEVVVRTSGTIRGPAYAEGRIRGSVAEYADPVMPSGESHPCLRREQVLQLVQWAPLAAEGVAVIPRGVRRSLRIAIRTRIFFGKLSPQRSSTGSRPPSPLTARGIHLRAGISGFIASLRPGGRYCERQTGLIRKPSETVGDRHLVGAWETCRCPWCAWEPRAGGRIGPVATGAPGPELDSDRLRAVPVGRTGSATVAPRRPPPAGSGTVHVDNR